MNREEKIYSLHLCFLLQHNEKTMFFFSSAFFLMKGFRKAAEHSATMVLSETNIEKVTVKLLLRNNPCDFSLASVYKKMYQLMRKGTLQNWLFYRLKSLKPNRWTNKQGSTGIVLPVGIYHISCSPESPIYQRITSTPKHCPRQIRCVIPSCYQWVKVKARKIELYPFQPHPPLIERGWRPWISLLKNYMFPCYLASLLCSRSLLFAHRIILKMTILKV